MKKKGRSLWFLLLMAISIYNSYGQAPNFASNITKYPSSEGNQLVIKYDLPTADTTQLFNISLRISYLDKVIQPDGNSLTGSWGNNVTPGTEKVILWDYPSELKNDISKVKVEVIATKLNKPMAKFEYKISNDKPPFEVRFDNQSKYADVYSWKFGDMKFPENNLSTQKSPVHVFKARGSYKVRLTATSKETNAIDSIIKLVTLGAGNDKEIQKHKTLKTIFIGSAVATAGLGTLFLVKSKSNWKDWTTSGDTNLKKKSNTDTVVGIAALAVTAASVAEVVIQSKKINSIKPLSMNYIPLHRGGVVCFAWIF